MAIINKTGIGNGNTIQAEHVTRIIDTLTNSTGSHVTVSGSFTGAATLTSATITGGTATLSSATIDGTLINGQSNTAGGSYSHAEGYQTSGSGDYSHAEGGVTTASNVYAHAEGYQTRASGISAHSEGYLTTGSGNYSHAEGAITTASGSYSHAEGVATDARGDYSHTEGASTTASGQFSHSEGQYTLALGSGAHAEGLFTTASGNYSHAEGTNSITVVDYSHAEGIFTIASGSGQHVSGKYNKHGDSTSLTIIGDGTNNASRSDIFKTKVGAVDISGSLNILSRGATSATDAVIIRNSSNIDLLTVQNDGNVGIGESAPSSRLYISASAPALPIGSAVLQTFAVRHLSDNSDYLEISNTRIPGSTDWGGAGHRLQARVDQTYMGYMQFNANNDHGISFGTGYSTTSGSLVPERMRITSAGSVGIGTTAPSFSLHVKGNGSTLALEGIDHTYMAFYPDGYAAGRKGYIGFANTTEDWLTVAGESANKGVALKAGGYVRQYVDPNGRISFGTSDTATPSHSIELQQQFGISPNADDYTDIVQNMYWDNNAPAGWRSRQGGPGSLLRMFGGTNQSGSIEFTVFGAPPNTAFGTLIQPTQSLWVDANSYVGIGSQWSSSPGGTRPDAPLHVVGSAGVGSNQGGTVDNVGIKVDATYAYNQGVALLLGSKNGNTPFIAAENTGSILFITSNTSRIKIDGWTGNVGIGTESPSSPLEIVGGRPGAKGGALLISSGAGADTAYAGAIVTTLTSSHNQHINIIKAGVHPHSLGYVSGTDKFMIAISTGSAADSTQWSAEAIDNGIPRGGFVQDLSRHGFNKNAPSASVHIKQSGGALLLEGDDHVFISFYPKKFIPGAGVDDNRKAYIGFGNSTSDDLTFANQQTGSGAGMIFQVSTPTPFNAMYISSSGRIGMGTNSPLATLDIRNTFGSSRVLSVSSGSVTPDFGYAGSIVSTMPSTHGQHINLISSGVRAHSIGFLPGTNKFMISRGKENGDSTWSSEINGGYVQADTLHGFNINSPVATLHVTRADVLNANGVRPTGNWAAIIENRRDADSDYNGLSVITRRASSTSKIFEAASSWNGSSEVYTPILTVLGNYRVGIGTDAPTHQLTLFSDSAAKPGASGLWTVSSDIRLKENIQEANYDTCYDIVKNLPLKRYTWKSEAYTTQQIADRTVLGWIAQDVNPLFPKAVTSSSFSGSGDFHLDDCLSLDAGQIYAAMYGTIKKLIVENESLKSELQTIKTHLGL